MTERRRVVWDEDNLTDNKAYFDANPVTKHIDEPKTPYEPDCAMDEEGNFVDSDDEQHKLEKNPHMHDWQPANACSSHNDDEEDDNAGGQRWDDETTSFARRARMAAPVLCGAGGLDAASHHSNPSSPFAAAPANLAGGGFAQVDTASSPDQSDFKKRRFQRPGGLGASGLSLSLDAPPTEEELKARDAAQHAAEFKHMRKAVYADEGAKFREQMRLAKLQAEADEAEEAAEEDAKEGDGYYPVN